MKNNYLSPQIEVIEIELEGVVASSPGGGLPGGWEDGGTGW